MVANPPLNGMEDQTDEDFFDKLVDDDFGLTNSSPIREEESDSEEAKAFANLRVDENEGQMLDVHSSPLTTMVPNICPASDSGTFGKSVESVEGPVETVSVSSTVVSSGNTASGVKEVGWSSFHTDLSLNKSKQLGSDSEFFEKLDVGGNSEEFFEKLDGDGTKPDVSSGSLNNGNLVSIQGEAETNLVNQHSLSDHLAWEEKYPGWKFDPNSGQWYQIDNFDGNTVVSESGSFDQKNGNTGISYLEQATTLLGGDTSINHNTSSWNQVSETNNNGYPEHMYFDPQYPGWYYDMVTQTWNTVESYTLSLQSTVMNSQALQVNNSSSYNGHVHGQQSDYSNQANFDFGQSTAIVQNHNGKNQHVNVNNSYSDSFGNPSRNFWQPETTGRVDPMADVREKKLSADSYVTTSSINNNIGNENSASYYQNAIQGNATANGFIGSQGFVPNTTFASQPTQYIENQMGSMNFSNKYYSNHDSLSSSQHFGGGNQQFSYNPNRGFSSDGRPPHTLVTFGFGGKILIVKDSSRAPSFSTQESKNGSVSVLNLMEAVLGSSTKPLSMDKVQNSYFHTLCQQSFPGPLVGGSVGNKELNKWIDERIAGCESPDLDCRKGRNLKLLFSLLKIAFQHYGKLRSSFGADASSRENDSPETAVAKLFASARNSRSRLNMHGSFSQCLQSLPSENQIQAMATEVQNYLVSGRTLEALHCAQQGQLWGPALVLASQLGNQYYVDTVKQMALHQLVAGSPLRTLCLLIAGEPREVFSSGMPSNISPRGFTASQRPTQSETNLVLDDWEENLAVIAANRTKDDEFVIVHLGDCLWKDRSEVIAAHICYLVAETNFELYSNSARLCLVAADHLKNPRTFATPEAIQRTELYEYSKVIGNSQFVLQPFQPYKLIYAYMLAEVGKVSDSLKYCQAVLRLLKTSRAPEVETWRQLASSLEERLKIHQQGGYATNLAPAKLVGKLLNFFDSTAHRVVGGLPPPAPSSSSQGNSFSSSMIHRVPASQSTMAMSSLIPSASMEPISEWNSDESRKIIHNRSVSEPDFGRTPRQEDATSNDKATSSVSSRFSRLGFGSQLIQKTVGLVLKSKSEKQAKLGEKNKFYYDEKLKRWVEEGAEAPTESAPPSQPPTSFQNGTTNYNLKSALKSDESLTNGTPQSTVEQTSGIPLLSSASNQFSARRTGARSRYVDTFNRGGGTTSGNSFPVSAPPAKPSIPTNTHFFVPASAPTTDYSMESNSDTAQHDTIPMENSSLSAPPQSQSASTIPMQRFPSMDNIESSSAMQFHSRRTASWSGSFNDTLTPPRPDNSAIGNGFRDELQEVEL